MPLRKSRWRRQLEGPSLAKEKRDLEIDVLVKSLIVLSTPQHRMVQHRQWSTMFPKAAFWEASLAAVHLTWNFNPAGEQMESGMELGELLDLLTMRCKFYRDISIVLSTHNIPLKARIIYSSFWKCKKSGFDYTLDWVSHMSKRNQREFSEEDNHKIVKHFCSPGHSTWGPTLVSVIRHGPLLIKTCVS